MPSQAPRDDERLERLRDLSRRITDAMAEMIAFEARVNAVLLEIARQRTVRTPGVHGKLEGHRARRRLPQDVQARKSA
jgi:hypothetical protein